VPGRPIPLEEALDVARTGDVWVFRGRSLADRAIQVSTNSPVNHVGMTITVEDLPPMMWHAELGRSLTDLWTGGRHRGVQLHDLRAAVVQWGTRYGQRAWLRQLEPPADRAMEDAALQAVARLDGTPFPSTARLAARWFTGRVPPRRQAWDALRRAGREGRGAVALPDPAELESAYCAEVVALTYDGMGLLDGSHRASWYDPGRFWSGDRLTLTGGATLGLEVAVEVSG
jgi:hypothetical protein